MKFAIVCFIGLLAFVQTGGAQPPVVSGQVRLDNGQPVAEAQVALFDLADLRQGAVVQVTTDETGHFALPLSALVGVFGQPEGFALGQSFPNPFNPSTIIPYQLAVAAHVRLEVFNTLGQHIATLVDGEQEAGMYQAQWSGTNEVGQAVAAGVYLYRLTVGEAHQTGRTVLIDGQAGTPENPRSGVSIDGHQRMSDAGGSAYGLVVSGSALVTYVDSDFGVEAGMAPVDIDVEAQGSGRMKRAQSQGILGDVDNNGRVDIADALLVAMYSANSSISIPNNGDISLGDVDGDGRIELEDAAFIAIYSTNPSDPTLPSGIGRPTGPDHGDTLAEATRINIGSATVGYIWSRDTDYFRVTVSGSGTLTAHTTSDIDTYGYIYDSSENQLASNDDAGPGGNFQVSAEVSPGTYYIRVRGYSSSTEGSYTLHVNMEGAEGDDHGNTLAEATRITTANVSGYLSPGDTDYFWVTAGGGRRNSVLTAYTTSDIDTYTYIYDSSGNELISNDQQGVGSSFPVSAAILNSGTYYIRVRGISSSTEGSYTLHVNEETEPPDGDLSIYSDMVHSIGTGRTTVGYLWVGDVDYFWVKVRSSGTLTVYTTGSLDTSGTIFDSSGDARGSDDNSGAGKNFQVSATVDPGTYHIRVKGSGNIDVGSYTLHVNSMATDDHGDRLSDATRIMIGNPTVGYISPEDQDYFRVRVSGSGTLMAYTTSDVGNYGSLYDSLGNELDSDDITGTDRNFRNFQVSAEVNPGTYYIRVGGYDSGGYLLYVMYEPDEDQFNIELVFTDRVTPYQRKLCQLAAARWMSVITGDLQNWDYSSNPFDVDIDTDDEDESDTFRVSDEVDDLRIYVDAKDIDGDSGTRAWARVCDIRNNILLASIGCIAIDSSDISSTSFPDTWSHLSSLVHNAEYLTMLHEMGHVLGISTHIMPVHNMVEGMNEDELADIFRDLMSGSDEWWDIGGHLWKLLLERLEEHILVARWLGLDVPELKELFANQDVYFTGPLATTAFDNAGGGNYEGNKVPLENDAEPGTAYGHWRSSVFDPPWDFAPSELMVGYSRFDQRLSAITSQALADLGYSVDVSQADPYTLPTWLNSAKPVADHGFRGHALRNCILPGPIRLVDENGRVVRTITIGE